MRRDQDTRKNHLHLHRATGQMMTLRLTSKHKSLEKKYSAKLSAKNSNWLFQDDDISKRNKLLLNARKARESRSHIGHPSNVPDAELEEEKR